MATRRSGLGRGLGALIPSSEGAMVVDVREHAYRQVDVEAIQPNAFQPRQHIVEEDLQSLAESIRELGVLQPLLVRMKTGNSYELIAGERRWRAAKLAGLKSVPVVVRDASDDQSLEQAIVENLHRKDLNAIDEATAYRQLIDDFSFKQEEVARRVGRSRSAVANILRLLQLQPKIQKLVREEKLSEGHARALLGVEDEKFQLQLAERAIKEGMNVRGVEEAVRYRNELERPIARATTEPTTKKPSNDHVYLEVREQLTDRLDTRVTVKSSGKGGKVVIDFADHEDLQRLIDVILRGGYDVEP